MTNLEILLVTIITLLSMNSLYLSYLKNRYKGLYLLTEEDLNTIQQYRISECTASDLTISNLRNEISQLKLNQCNNSCKESVSLVKETKNKNTRKNK